MFAVVVGLYEKMVAAISNFRQAPLKHLKFLIPIMIGAVIGVLASTKLVLWLCERFPVMSYGFFIGLVVGVLPFVFKKMHRHHFDFGDVLLIALGFAFIMVVSHQGSQESSEFVALTQPSSLGDWATIGFAGFFAIAMMMIPGISGAVMLMMVNQYGTIYNAVAKLVDAAMFIVIGKFGAAQSALASVLILVPFIIGAFLGVIIAAKILNYLLRHYSQRVYSAVLGIILAGIWILAELALKGAQLGIQEGSSWLGMGLSFVLFIIIGTLATIFLDQQEPTHS